MFPFSRLFIVSSLALVAAATPWNQNQPTTTITDTALPTATMVSQCNTSGEPQCCQITTTADSTAGADILGLLRIIVEDIEEVIGIGCSPITVGQSCSYEPVCCDESGYGDSVALGCVPVTL
ncbi:fungal hydrophobin [Daedalea quercina L-15889]|uniref:Hydrophobin n=1 Tax=Daedalea quercina L-15889 TaxID=1314783 RepID=A0A165RCW2_9APHY|nr:fungal hydrophobin [Daedalea quercina L-15889]